MPFAVVLDLDTDTEARLRHLAGRLNTTSDFETPPLPGDAHHHISLGVYDDLALDRFMPMLAKYADASKPLAVRLANIGIFPSAQSVLYLGPVVTNELLALHDDFHAAFAAFAGSCWAHYLPGAWVPHVTLAINIAPGALGGAVSAVAARWTPAAARLDALRLVQFPPISMLYRHSL